MTHAPRGSRSFIDANGLTISYLWYPGEGPDIVIVPGITSPAMAVDFLAVELAPSYNVYCLDVRGRGQSDRAQPGSYQLVDYANDLREVLTGLKLVDPILIGHSLGARIVAAAAAGVAQHGQLVFVDPPLSGPSRPYPTSIEMFRQQLDESRSGTTADEIRGWYPLWAQRELEVRVQELPTCDVTAVEESYLGLEQDEFLPYWRDLTPRLAMIYGADSPVVTSADIATLASANPAAIISSVPGAGHMVPWDNFDGFMTELRAVLKDQA